MSSSVCCKVVSGHSGTVTCSEALPTFLSLDSLFILFMSQVEKLLFPVLWSARRQMEEESKTSQTHTHQAGCGMRGCYIWVQTWQWVTQVRDVQFWCGGDVKGVNWILPLHTLCYSNCFGFHVA